MESYTEWREKMQVFSLDQCHIKRILVEKNHCAKVLEDDVYIKFRIIHGLGKHGFSTEYRFILKKKKDEKTRIKRTIK